MSLLNGLSNINTDRAPTKVIWTGMSFLRGVVWQGGLMYKINGNYVPKPVIQGTLRLWLGLDCDRVGCFINIHVRLTVPCVSRWQCRSVLLLMAHPLPHCDLFQLSCQSLPSYSPRVHLLQNDQWQSWMVLSSLSDPSNQEAWLAPIRIVSLSYVSFIIFFIFINDNFDTNLAYC